MKLKRVTQFKAGDIIHYRGSRFLIEDDAAESVFHRPHAGPLEPAAGPSDVATATGHYIDGPFKGYLGHESYLRWCFMGDFQFNNGLYRVEERS